MRDCLLVCVSLGIALGAQTPAPAAPNTAQFLFQQAKAGLEPIPEEDRPVVMSQIVGLELKVFPKQAIEDYKTLFQMALDLPPRGFNQYLKSQTELGSVIALVRLQELEAALALAQHGDVPRSNMYNWVLVRAAKQWPVARTAALVQECAQSGSFPYQAALAVAKSSSDDVITRDQLVRSIYKAAGNETNLINFGLTGGFESLIGGHELAPQLDAELESALVSFLTRTGSDSQPINASAAAKLMALLKQIDADKAQELEARFPALVVAPPSPPTYGDVGSNGKFVQRPGTPPQIAAEDMAKTDPGGALTFASGQASPLDRFHALVAVASAEATTQPELARQAAKEAAAMAGDDDFLKQSYNAATAASLALAEDKLGQHGDARSLMAHLLDLADQDAADYEQLYRSLPLDPPDPGKAIGPQQSQRFLASQMGFQPVQTSNALGVYEAAAKLEFEIAAARVQKLPSEVLRPLAEAHVAAQMQ